MSERKIRNRVYCPVDYAFRRIGGKYKGRILWVLREGRKRYGELKREVVGITPKMLSQALKELEVDGLIERTEFLAIPPKVEYALLETGKELIPFISLLRKWAEEQIKINNVKVQVQGVKTTQKNIVS